MTSANGTRPFPHEPCFVDPPVLGDDLSASPDPLTKPTPLSPRILVIGGGVTGLTISWLLLDRGYHVTIISKKWASFGPGQRLTSQIAGALWELPPAGCGPQAVQGKLKMVQKWAIESLRVYEKIAANKELARNFGVSFKMCTSFHTNRIDDDDVKKSKMKLVLENCFEGFYRGMDLVDKYDCNKEAHGGLHDAYEHMAPMVDTDKAMDFLMDLVRRKGAEMHTATVGYLVEQEHALLAKYRSVAIVNATGLMAREVARDDTVRPLRGAVLRAVNNGRDFPQVKNAMLVSTESRADGNFRDMAFIVPRNDDILVLGSITQADEWDLDLTTDSDAIQDMRRRCEDLVPALKHARLDPGYPLAQGGRPWRNDNVRVEREPSSASSGEQSRIVHCYGHGGAGWSLAFGSGRQAMSFVEDIVEECKLIPKGDSKL